MQSAHWKLMVAYPIMCIMWPGVWGRPRGPAGGFVRRGAGVDGRGAKLCVAPAGPMASPTHRRQLVQRALGGEVGVHELFDEGVACGWRAGGALC